MAGLGMRGSFFTQHWWFSGSATNRDCCKPAFSCHLEEESSLQLDPFSQKLSSASGLSLILTDTWKYSFPGKTRSLGNLGC